MKTPISTHRYEFLLRAVYSWSRFGVILSSFIFAFLLRRDGNTGAFVYIAITMLLVFLVIGGTGARTDRRRLEEIAR